MYPRRFKLIISAAVVSCLATAAFGQNIDPNDDGAQYAYGENVGWLNFQPGQGPGVTVGDANLTGYVWAENIGWINLSPALYGGVANDGTGQLSGYAWAQNVGWINFNPKVAGDPNHYGVAIDGQGNFDGWAWGENIGWIHLRSETPVPYKVQTSWVTTCKVGFDDLGRFVGYWLGSAEPLTADLDDNGTVDFNDYGKLAQLWLEQCPPGWPLKE
jgi:hypothetical protein